MVEDDVLDFMIMEGVLQRVMQTDNEMQEKAEDKAARDKFKSEGFDELRAKAAQ